MCTYGSYNKVHPEIQVHCSSAVSRQLFDYNPHLIRPTENTRAINQAGSKTTSIIATSPYYTPQDLPALCKRREATRLLDLLDHVMLSPYVSSAETSYMDTAISRKQIPMGQQIVSSAYNTATLPCKNTIYRSDYAAITNSPIQLRLCNRVSKRETFHVPYETQAITELPTTIYRGDFAQHPMMLSAKDSKYISLNDSVPGDVMSQKWGRSKSKVRNNNRKQGLHVSTYQNSYVSPFDAKKIIALPPI